MEIATIVLEYLKVILGFSVTVPGLVLVVLWLYRNQVVGVLTRILHLEYGQGTLKATFQQQQTSTPDSLPKPLPEPTKMPGEAVLENTGAARREEGSAEENNASLENQLAAARNLKSQLIEVMQFSNLNMFFVPNTKNLLAWLDITSPAEYLAIQGEASLMGIQKENIGTTISVLLQNQMAELDGSKVRITDRGKRFLTVIGWRYDDTYRGFFQAAFEYWKGKAEKSAAELERITKEMEARK